MPWTLMESSGEQMAYVTEVSETPLRRDGYGPATTCPDCQGRVVLESHRVEGAIVHWAGTCPICTARLTIIND